MDRDEGLGIRLGVHRVPVLGEVSSEMDSAAHGVVSKATVLVSDLVEQPADYRPTARLEAGSTNINGGWINEAIVNGSHVSIEVSTALPFTENQIGFLASRMPPTELAWSMAAWLELKAVVPDLKRYREQMLVVVPLAGVDLEGTFGPVQVTRNKAMIRLLVGVLKPSAERTEFQNATSWAMVETEADLLLEAERLAVPKIENAVATLKLEAHYSLATEPSGAALNFRRGGVRTDPTPLRTVLVAGQRTRRIWLRHLDQPRVTTSASSRRFELPSFVPDARWMHAVRAWDRASRHRDRLAAVGDLFEAVEFYAAETSASPLFPPGTRTRIVSAIRGLGLTPKQEERMRDVVGRANEPPLRVRLVSALDIDHVPYSSAEIDRLWRLRIFRNHALHGRERREPTRDDLEHGLALVNRMLIFRAWRGAVLQSASEAVDG